MSSAATRVSRSAVSTAAVLTCAAAAAPSVYIATLTAAASFVRPAKADHRAPAPVTRFAICVPAHNESSVIAETVAALRNQRYPPELFDVHVVADNCSDDTADIAATNGATIHVRTDANNPGKGPALNWLHARLDQDSFDALVIIDADTIADANFLTALDRSFVSGSVAVQGRYSVRAPETSPAVALRYAALACRHHLRPLGRTALGGSCGLYGNGMAFETSTIAHRRWSGHLIEDAEFQSELLLDGIRVDYAPDAIVVAEMPSSLESATTQNERWELGRRQLIGRFVPLLLRRLRTGGRLPSRVYVDAIADHLVPPLSLLAAVDFAAVTLGTTNMAVRRTRSSWWLLGIGTMSAGVLLVHVVTALRMVEAPRSVYRSLTSAPQAICWKLALLLRISRPGTEVSWTRTQRNNESQNNEHDNSGSPAMLQDPKPTRATTGSS